MTIHRNLLAFGLLGVFLLGLPGLARAQQPAAPSGIGVVTAIQGQASVTRQALPQPSSLRFKDDVFFRDQIATKERSTVRLLLGGKGVLTVREQSQVTLDETVAPDGGRRSILGVLTGKIGAAIARSLMGPGDEVEVRTPDAVAAVRGTVFIVEYIPPQKGAEIAKPVLLASSAPGPFLAQAPGASGGRSNFFVLSGFVTVTPQGQPPLILGPLQSLSLSAGAGGVVTGTVLNITPAEAAQAAQGLDAGRPPTGAEGGRIAQAQTQLAAALTNLVLGGSAQPQSQGTPNQPASTSQTTTNVGVIPDVTNDSTPNVPPAGAFLGLDTVSLATALGTSILTFDAGTPNTVIPIALSGSGQILWTDPLAATGTTISHSGSLVDLKNGAVILGASNDTVTPLAKIDGTTLTNTDGPMFSLDGGPNVGTELGTGLTTSGPILRLQNGGNAELAGVLGTVGASEVFLGPANGVEVLTGSSLTATAPLFSLTGGSILGQVSGGDLISIGGTLSVTGGGSLVSASDSGGTDALNTSMVLGGSVLSSNGGTVTLNGTGAAVQLNNANLALINGGSLISLNSGASLTASGPALDAVNDSIISTAFEGGGGPIFAFRGGSRVNWTGGPLIRLNNSFLFAEGGFGDSDGAGNLINISGAPGTSAVLLDATDSTIDFGSSRIPNAGPTDSDVVTFSAPPGVPFIRLTRSTYLDSNPDSELVPHSDGTSTFNGLFVVASSSDITAGEVLDVCCGDQLTTTTTAPLIQLTSTNVTSGTNMLEVGSGPPGAPSSSLTVAGPLLDATNSTLSSGAGSSLVSVNSGGRLSNSASSALLSFSGSSVDAGAQFFIVRDSGSQVNLAGPLVSDDSSTFNITNHFLRIAEGGSLTSTSPNPLISLSGTTFIGGTGAGTNTGGSLLRMFSAIGQTGNNLSLRGSLLSASGSAFTTTDGSFVNVRDGASLTTSLTSAPLLSLTGSSVLANENVFRFGPDGTDSLGNPGSRGPVAVSLSGPLLRATDTSFQATNSGFLGLRNQTTFTGGGISPLISLNGTAPGTSSVSTPSSNFMFLAAASGLTPPTMNLTNSSGSLLDTTNTSITAGTPNANNNSFLFVGDGATLTSAGTVPLTTFVNSSLTTAGVFLSVRRSGADTSTVNLSGSLLSASNSDFTTFNSVTAGGCCSFLFVGEGGRLQGSGLDALLQSSNSSFPNIGGSFVNVTPTANLGDSTPAPSSITLSGPLMDDFSSTFTIAGSLLRVADGSRLSSTTSLPLMKFDGSTVSAASLLFLRGVTTDPSTGLGTDLVLQTGGPIIELNGATPATGATVNLTGAGNAIRVDTALLNASAPIINLINSTLNTSATGDAVTGSMHVFRSSVTSNGPIIGLDNSTLQVNNGPALSLTGGSQMTVNGDLARLFNGARVIVQNGPMVFVDGPNSRLNVTGALVNFGGTGGNQIIINNSIVPNQNPSGVPSFVGPGSSVSIGPNPITNPSLGTISINPSTGSPGSVIRATNGGVVNITAGTP